MTMRPIRIILITLAAAGCFLAGYFNQQISTFFFNKDALIGALTMLFVGYFLYSQFLEKKNIRLRYENEAIYDKLENSNSRYWNREELEKVINNNKEEIINLFRTHIQPKKK